MAARARRDRRHTRGDSHILSSQRPQRYCGWYANRPHGVRRRAAPAIADAHVPIMTAPRLAPTEATRRWAALLRQIFELCLHRGLVRRTARTQLLRMTSSALLSQILQLPREQRLQLVEDIWDSLAQAEAGVPVPEWHRSELDRRLADPNEQETLSWDEVQQRLKPQR